MPTIQSLKQTILAECEDDHVGLWSAIRDAEDLYPGHAEGTIRDHVLAALRDLLLAKEIRAGFPKGAGAFQSLRITPDKVIARIESEWPVGRRPTVGEGLWFTRARKSGRRLAGFVKKYGSVEGGKMYRRLQQEAGLASAHARHKKRLRAKDR